MSKAEVAYKSGKVSQAMKYGKQVLKFLDGKDAANKIVAVKIFIARCLSKLGKFAESSKIYRELLREEIYFAPVVMGLFYNNFCDGDDEKLNLNLGLVKTCLLLP